MTSILLYSDGACSGNPGPGGWGAVLLYGERGLQISGFEENTTNNRMEITAVIQGLKHLQRPCHVEVYTDSRYVQHTFEKSWIESWQKNGWKTRDGKMVKNQDLWIELIKLKCIHNISWNWVPGHSGHYYNEMCDKLARNAIAVKTGIKENFVAQENKINV